MKIPNFSKLHLEFEIKTPQHHNKEISKQIAKLKFASNIHCYSSNSIFYLITLFTIDIQCQYKTKYVRFPPTKYTDIALSPTKRKEEI